MAHKVLSENSPVILFVHPQEINPSHPRLPMNMKRRFMNYVNIKTTEPKIRSILQDFEVTSFDQFMNETLII